MTKTEARRLLREVRESGSDWWTARRSWFVFGPLEDAIRLLDVPSASIVDRRLAAVGYAFKGDVSDFTMDAPRAAARAYRAAVRCDPRDTWSWSELGSMLNNMGQYGAALRAVSKAKALGRDDFILDVYLEEANDAIRDGDDWCWYRDGCAGSEPAPSWDVCELLARNRPRAPQQLLRRRRHPYLLKLRARAYGALGDTPQLLAQWERLSSTEGEVEIEAGDWFFFPDEVWDTPRFWRALYALRHRLGYGWSYMHDAIDKAVPDPKRHSGESAANLARHRRRMTLWFRYEIARTEHDAPKAARLASRYPRWPQAVRLAKRLA